VTPRRRFRSRHGVVNVIGDGQRHAQTTGTVDLRLAEQTHLQPRPDRPDVIKVTFWLVSCGRITAEAAGPY
jgi:hypothetical protein